jgi:hypothetical protein
MRILFDFEANGLPRGSGLREAAAARVLCSESGDGRKPSGNRSRPRSDDKRRALLLRTLAVLRRRPLIADSEMIIEFGRYRLGGTEDPGSVPDAGDSEESPFGRRGGGSSCT